MANYSIFFIGIAGAIFNRMRGGGLVDIFYKIGLIKDAEKGVIKPLSKILHDTTFAFIFTLYSNISFKYSYPVTMLLIYQGMLLGRCFGWGSYIGGMIDKKINPVEIGFIDKFLMIKSDHPVARNCAALSLRGLIWGLSIAVSFIIAAGAISMPLVFIALSGSLMGLVYLVAIEICDVVPNIKRGSGWQVGEALWGFTFWSLIALFLS